MTVGPDNDRFGLLSERERTTMLLAAEGYSMGETGAILDISARTVEVYRANAIRKLGARNIVQAAVMVDRVFRGKPGYGSSAMTGPDGTGSERSPATVE